MDETVDRAILDGLLAIIIESAQNTPRT
jgi:hypothetical protein